MSLFHAPILLLLATGCGPKPVDTAPEETGISDTDTAGAPDVDGDGYAADVDCNDADAGVNPAAAEVCDGVDQDCDLEIDEDATDLTSWYLDAEGDAHGDPALVEEACTAPAGYSALGDDCDDANPAVHPEAEEADCANPVDYNCDGSVGFSDADGDGFAACLECDDTNGQINPAATEVCDDLDTDEDCSGAADDADAGVDPTSQANWFADADTDGYGDLAVVVAACEPVAGHVADSTDCDDTDSAFHPSAEESDCTDPADYNCDGSTGYIDGDGDGFAACEECDDASSAVSPAGVEACNAVDDNCDGQVDEAGATGEATWFLDRDADGFGLAGASIAACDVPAGYVVNAEDCDDTNGSVNPAESEFCDGVDDDCDGVVDEGDALDATFFNIDADNDGHADPVAGDWFCSEPAGYGGANDDCNDSNAAIYPDSSGACAAGTSCDDALVNGELADGVYSIDPDGPAGVMPVYDVWCDMTEDGGGWALLFSANGSSTTWGNNAPAWSDGAWDAAAPPSSLADDDYKSQAYLDFETSEIRICYGGTTQCYAFDHGLGIPLNDFFALGITHVEHAEGMYAISDVEAPDKVDDYLADLGVTQHSVDCTWLGINDMQSGSAIGLVGDWNGGCGEGYGNFHADDLAIGVGLQSCYDANGCSSGGTENAAGQSRGLNGVDDSGVVGPWHVFGR